MYGYKIFHDKLMSNLTQTVRNGNNANTYIFEGEAGLNVKECANLFAQTLVCTDPDNAPCGNCPACIEAKSGVHPDIVYVKPEKDKSTIGVAPIRAMISECLIKPFYNRHKVFIVEDGDILTPQAQNAFLKIIEEPPDYAVFIIICTNRDILLQTVQSRAVTLTFGPVDDDTVRRYIESTHPDEAQIEFLVKFCAGIPTYADEIIGNTEFETLREEVLNIIPKMLSKNKAHAYDVADFFDLHKDNAAQICDIILMYLRDAVVYAMGAVQSVVNSDKSDKIQLLAQKYPTSTLTLAADEVVTAKKMLDRYVKASAVALRTALAIK